jgi:hypothetical protein
MATSISLIPIAAFSLGLLTSLATFYLWLSQSVRKRYAAEREFEHLKAKLETNNQFLIQIEEDIQNLRIEVIRYMERDK